MKVKYPCFECFMPVEMSRKPSHFRDFSLLACEKMSSFFDSENMVTLVEPHNPLDGQKDVILVG